jgi:hypothetical protein
VAPEPMNKPKIAAFPVRKLVPLLRAIADPEGKGKMSPARGSCQGSCRVLRPSSVALDCEKENRQLAAILRCPAKPAEPLAIHGKEGVAGSSPAEGLGTNARRKRVCAPWSCSSAAAERVVRSFWVPGLVAVASLGAVGRPFP